MNDAEKKPELQGKLLAKGGWDYQLVDELTPQEGDIVVAYIDGEFTLKRVKFDTKGDCLWLMPANKDYPPIKVTEENNFIVWGVLTYNIKRQYRRK